MLRALRLPLARGLCSFAPQVFSSELPRRPSPPPLSWTTAVPWPRLGALTAFLRFLAVVGGLSPSEESRWTISTFKRRRTKMNRHKLKKRRKLLRLNTKTSRS